MKAYAGCELHVKRPTSTIVFAMGINVLMWLITIVDFSLSMYIIWFSKLSHSRGAFGLSVFLIIALPYLRSVQPNVPPIGIAIDFLAFTWCMIIASFTLISIFCAYFGQIYDAKHRFINSESYLNNVKSTRNDWEMFEYHDPETQ
eukprot:Pgem_evm1s13875